MIHPLGPASNPCGNPPASEQAGYCQVLNAYSLTPVERILSVELGKDIMEGAISALIEGMYQISQLAFT